MDRGYAASLCILEWVQLNVSEFLEAPGTEEGKSLMQNVLESGYGLCGTKAYVFNQLAKDLGFPSRYIQIYNITPLKNRDGMTNHVVSEIYYGDKWHLYDPTYIMFFEDENGEVLDYESVLKLSVDERQAAKRMNSLSLRYQLDPFDEYHMAEQNYNYFASDTKDVIVSGSGLIHIDGDKENSFAQLPDYAGKYYFAQDDALAEIKLGIKSDKETYRQLVLNIKKFWCVTEGDIEINIETSHGEKKLVFSKDDREENGQEVTVDLNWPGTEDIYLTVKNADNTDDTCLVYFDSIQVL